MGTRVSDAPQTAAGRVLAVLGVFTPAHGALTLSEISRYAGLSMTTAHRLVGELREWGALERDRAGRYVVGLRLLELTALAPRGLALRELALPFLDDLHHATRANVHLSLRDGHEVVYVESLKSRGAVEVLSTLGGRWPVHATATGQVLLAHAPVRVQDEVLAGPLERFTDNTLVDPRALRAQLAEVRRTGMTLAVEQLTPGAVAVAMPVRGTGDDVVAAVGLILYDTVTARAMVPALAATARGISRALGSPSARPLSAALRVD